MTITVVPSGLLFVWDHQLYINNDMHVQCSFGSSFVRTVSGTLLVWNQATLWSCVYFLVHCGEMQCAVRQHTKKQENTTGGIVCSSLYKGLLDWYFVYAHDTALEFQTNLFMMFNSLRQSNAFLHHHLKSSPVQIRACHLFHWALHDSHLIHCFLLQNTSNYIILANTVSSITKQSNCTILIYTQFSPKCNSLPVCCGVARADPGFEVRGGANGS